MNIDAELVAEYLKVIPIDKTQKQALIISKDSGLSPEDVYDLLKHHDLGISYCIFVEGDVRKAIMTLPGDGSNSIHNS